MALQKKNKGFSANGRYELVRIVSIHCYDDKYLCMRPSGGDMFEKISKEASFKKTITFIARL